MSGDKDHEREPRRCRGCGKPEEVSALGYTNLAPALGYCVECIDEAARRQDAVDERRSPGPRTRKTAARRRDR